MDNNKLIIGAVVLGALVLSQKEGGAQDILMGGGGGGVPTTKKDSGVSQDEIIINIPPQFPPIPSQQPPQGFFDFGGLIEYLQGAGGTQAQGVPITSPTPPSTPSGTKAGVEQAPIFQAKKRQAQSRVFQETIQKSTREQPYFTSISEAFPYFPSVLLSPEAKQGGRFEMPSKKEEKSEMNMSVFRGMQIPQEETRVTKKEEIAASLSPISAWARATAIKSSEQHPLPTQKHMPTVEKVSKRRTIIRQPLYSGGTKKGGVIRRHDPNVGGN